MLLSDRTHLARMHKAPGPKQPPKGRKDKSVEHMVVARVVDQFWLNLSISVHQSVYPSATGDTVYNLKCKSCIFLFEVSVYSPST